MEYSAIVLAILSFLGTIIMGFLQLRLWKSQAYKEESVGKKESANASSILVETAINLNKHELEIIRTVNTSLCADIQQLHTEIDALEIKLRDAKIENANLITANKELKLTIDIQESELEELTMKLDGLQKGKS